MDDLNSASVSSPPIESAIEGRHAVQSLQVDTQLDEGRRADQREPSPGGRPRERMLFASQTRYASPEPLFVCDGWCKYGEDSHPNVVSIGHPLLRGGGPHVWR